MKGAGSAGRSNSAMGALLVASRQSGLLLFLCGDVMTGRGVDQILPHPGSPELYEPYIRTALRYVSLAEARNGRIRRPVRFDYVWGVALRVLERVRPDIRIINLETSITAHDAAFPKGINYRMHPDNHPVLSAASVNCCVLANNHTLDYGGVGLVDTLEALARAGIAATGAGRNRAAAAAPAVLPAGGHSRVLVFGIGTVDSGIPIEWRATSGSAGINMVAELDAAAVMGVARAVQEYKRDGDLVIASIHWGGNWGYEIPDRQRSFAHRLIDEAGVHVVHGHSSHHPKAVEVYRERLILYGCGDFIDDYEGISGFEEFRDDLVLMYLPVIELGSGRLVRLEMVPFQLRRMRLCTPSPADLAWLHNTLDRECRRFDHGVRLSEDGTLILCEMSRAG